MAGPTKQGELFGNECTAPGAIAINGRCAVRTQDGWRVVIVAGVSLAYYALADRMAEANAMVSLVEQGWADQNEVARAFGCSARTVRCSERQ